MADGKEEGKSCPHYTTQATCDKCGKKWVAVHPVTGADCLSLECPGCEQQNWMTAPSAPIHLIISSMNGAVWVKPNRVVPRAKLIALVSEALAMLLESSVSVVKPEDCPLRAFLTVDDSQQFEDK